MRTFNISSPDETLRPSIQERIDNLNKPKGSLGRLEELAMQVCLIQQTLSPSLVHPCHLLLGGDHGIEREGVSARRAWVPAISEVSSPKSSASLYLGGQRWGQERQDYCSCI